MKFGRDTIKGLTQKNTARGFAYYWQPTPAERAKGWKGLALGSDPARAVELARRRNDEIDNWKSGGARPRQVSAYVARSTFGAVLDRYEREVLATKAKNTQRVDRTAIKRLRVWAGDKPFAWIDRKRVRTFRNELVNNIEIDGPGHAVAFHLLTTLRKIIGWYMRQEDLGKDNPADRFELAMPAPRHQIWEADADAALHAAADAMGEDGVALAYDIASYTGQREGDVLAYQLPAWREISLQQLGNDQALYDALASPTGPDAGKVMGLYVKQGKTGRWVGIPIEGGLRTRIEAVIATRRLHARETGRVGAMHLVSRDASGTPWPQRDFIDRFAQVRTRAADDVRAAGNDELADRLADLQFRDLRRTCIVKLGLLGLNNYQIHSITGHNLETIDRILKVYMPRTEAAAGAAVVARIGKRGVEKVNEQEKRA